MHANRTSSQRSILTRWVLVLTLAWAGCAGAPRSGSDEPLPAEPPGEPLGAVGLKAHGIPASNPRFPHYPDTIRARFPFDIDFAFRNTLDIDDPSQRAVVQRLFDIFSWETFLALQWPLDAAGDPAASLTASGDPQWVFWKAPYEVFKPDGSAPAAWDSRRHYAFDGQSMRLAPEARVLTESQKSLSGHLKQDEHPLRLDGGEQAFSSGQLRDQNGNLVRYEALMNRILFDVIVKNELYTLDGQVAYAAQHDSCAIFGWGNSSRFPDERFAGAMTLKLAWKQMDPGVDRPERYFTREALVHGAEDGPLETRTYGLVGMHIAHKTNSSKNWVWSTFEHVDNVDVDRLSEAPRAQPAGPAFYDPECDSCAVNLPAPPGDPRPTQVLRVMQIDEATAALNREVRARLRAMGSVWQYYRLVGTQWPIPPASGSRCDAEAVAAVDPQPPHLANVVLETFFQEGNQRVGDGHTFVFSSCMQCHKNASIAVGLGADGSPQWGGPLSGDFVWMFKKAHRRSLAEVED